MSNSIAEKTWLEKVEIGANLFSGAVVALYLGKTRNLALAFPIIAAGGIVINRKSPHKGVCLGAAAGIAVRGLGNLRGALTLTGARRLTPALQLGWGGSVLGVHYLWQPHHRGVSQAKPDVDEAIALLQSYSDYQDDHGAGVGSFSGLRVSDDGKALEVDTTAGRSDLAVAVANLLSVDLFEKPFLERRHEADLVGAKLEQAVGVLTNASQSKILNKKATIEKEVGRFNGHIFPLADQGTVQNIRAQYASFVGTTNQTFTYVVEMNFGNSDVRTQQQALSRAVEGITGRAADDPSCNALALLTRPLDSLQWAYVGIVKAAINAQKWALVKTYGVDSADALGAKRNKVYAAQSAAIQADPSLVQEWERLDLALVQAALQEGILPQDYSHIVQDYYQILKRQLSQATAIRRTGDELTDKIENQLNHTLMLKIMREFHDGKIPEILQTIAAVAMEAQKRFPAVDQAIDQTMGAVMGVVYQYLAPKADALFEEEVKELPKAWRQLGTKVANYQQLKTQLALVARARSHINVIKLMVMVTPDDPQHPHHAAMEALKKSLTTVKTDFDDAYDAVTKVQFAEQEANAEMLKTEDSYTNAENYARILQEKCQASSSSSTSAFPSNGFQIPELPGIDPQQAQQLMDEFQKVIRPTSAHYLPVDEWVAQAQMETAEMEGAQWEFFKELGLAALNQTGNFLENGRDLLKQVADDNRRKALLPQGQQYQLLLKED